MKVVTLIFFLSLNCFMHAQMDAVANELLIDSNLTVTVFKTYEDYTNNTGEVKGQYSYVHRHNPQIRNFYLECRKDGAKNGVNTRRYWGFKLGSDLFRLNRWGYPFKVYHVGEIVYYEAAFSITKTGLSVAHEDNSDYYYSEAMFSLTLNTVLFYDNTAMKLSRKGKPELKDLCDCIKESKAEANADDYERLEARKKKKVLAYRKCLGVN